MTAGLCVHHRSSGASCLVAFGDDRTPTGVIIDSAARKECFRAGELLGVG